MRIKKNLKIRMTMESTFKKLLIEKRKQITRTAGSFSCQMKNLSQYLKIKRYLMSQSVLHKKC